MNSPDRWFVLSARTPAEELRPLVADALLALGGTSVLEEGDALVTYLPPPADPAGYLTEARAAIAGSLAATDPPELSWRWQENEDWARRWKEGLGPRKLTDRLVVKPTWSEWEASDGEIVVSIDPQMAFGTGEHATTRGCLRLLDGALRAGDRVLDVGSGSGILAIAAARLGAAGVVAVEYDADANLNARDNFAQNGVADRIGLIGRLADPALLAGLGRFDLILANILSGVIRPLLPAFRDALGGSAEGRLIVSGILQSEHEDVVRDAAAAGFRVVRTDEEGEWWSALLVPTGSRDFPEP